MSKKQRKSILYFYDILAGIHALILLIIIGRNHNIDLFENCKLQTGRASTLFHVSPKGLFQKTL